LISDHLNSGTDRPPAGVTARRRDGRTRFILLSDAKLAVAIQWLRRRTIKPFDFGSSAGGGAICPGGFDDDHGHGSWNHARGREVVGTNVTRPLTFQCTTATPPRQPCVGGRRTRVHIDERCDKYGTGTSSGLRAVSNHQRTFPNAQSAGGRDDWPRRLQPTISAALTGTAPWSRDSGGGGQKIQTIQRGTGLTRARP